MLEFAVVALIVVICGLLWHAAGQEAQIAGLRADVAILTECLAAHQQATKRFVQVLPTESSVAPESESVYG